MLERIAGAGEEKRRGRPRKTAKRRLSAEGRARISAAAVERWRIKKAAA